MSFHPETGLKESNFNMKASVFIEENLKTFAAVARLSSFSDAAEELGITVRAPCLAPLTFASHGYDDFHLLMPLFVCRRWEGIAAPREGQALKWVMPGKLRDYPMPPADEPLFPHLQALL